MKGFLLGLVVASLGWGGFVYWKVYRVPEAPARMPVPAVSEADPPAKNKRRPKRRRTAEPAPVLAGDEPPEPEPIALSAADLRVQAKGDDLSAPDVVQMDLQNDDGPGELSQDAIDARFRPQEGAILNCISEARPDDVTFIPGKVTVGFRIQRTGRVRGVRVNAPAILMRGGLYECVRAIVSGLGFPASNGSRVVTYPYQLS